MKLEENEVLVVEGIHCLNDKLTESIPKDKKFKIYISALTVLNIDYYNRISTTDTRLIRRIVRDYRYRGSIVYEHGVLREYALPLLRDIQSTEQEYAEAKRLMTFLNYFKPLESKYIPEKSIIREFIGGSIFTY